LWGADAVLIATEWPEFRDLTSDDAVSAMRQAFVFDPSRFLESSLGSDERIRYFAIGRPLGRGIHVD
jgi:UDPglucose 6-dehydrogenase